jgi:hypothetical protein
VTDIEIRLRCLELALAQVKVEGLSQDLNRVAEIQTLFYDRIVSAPKPDQATARKSSKVADKTPEIFG